MTDSIRRRVIAGNWKMYKTVAETRAFFSAFAPLVANSTHCDIVVAPPFTALAAAAQFARGTKIAVSAQDLYWEKEGAFTGEVSGETDEAVGKKTKAALVAGLTPIVCIGETLAAREAENTEAVLEKQFLRGSGSLTPEEFSRILIAYEPVWAIGTGRTATPEIAAAAHRFLRQCGAKQFSTGAASALRILYGGSVKPDNIHGLMAQEELDGALVGGASLEAKSFAAIVNYM